MITPTLTDVIDTMIATRFCDEVDLVGCSDDDIDDLELRCGLKLPETYVEFMKVAGRTRASASFTGDPFSLHIDDAMALLGELDDTSTVARQHLLGARHGISWVVVGDIDARPADAAVFDRDINEAIAAGFFTFVINLLTAPRALNEAQRSGLDRVRRIDWQVLGIVEFDPARALLFEAFVTAAQACAAHHPDVDMRELGCFSLVQQMTEVPRVPEVTHTLQTLRLRSRAPRQIAAAIAGFIAWEGFDRATRLALWADGGGRNPLAPLMDYLEQGGDIDAEHGIMRGLLPRRPLQLSHALPGLSVLDDDEAADLQHRLFADPGWRILQQRWDTRWCTLVASSDDGHVLVAVATQTWIVSPPTRASKHCTIHTAHADWREVAVTVTRNAAKRAAALRR